MTKLLRLSIEHTQKHILSYDEIITIKLHMLYSMIFFYSYR